MPRYDELLDAGRMPLTPCPICTGDDEAEVCSPECEMVVLKAFRATYIKDLYAHARDCVVFARRYLKEEGPMGRRVLECLLEMHRCRRTIAGLRQASRERHENEPSN